MNILILSNKMPYPPKDGGSIATFCIARSFAALGHKVTVLAMNTLKHYYNTDLIPKDISGLIEFIGVDVDTQISVFDALKNLLTKSIPYNAQRFISEEFENRLAGLLQTRSFDVVQLEGTYLGPYIHTSRKYSTALVIIRSHNIEH